MSQQAAPANNPARRFTRGSDSFRLQRASDMRTAGSFPGAACFARFGRINVETNFARADRLTPKRLPSGALDNRSSHQQATPFEDEDDDENDSCR